MPLIQGYSRTSIGKNVKREARRLKKASPGRPKPEILAQAVAISLNVAREAWRRKTPKGAFPKHLRRR